MFKGIKTICLDFDNCIVATTEAIVSLYNEDFIAYKKFKPVNWWEVNTWDFQECNCASREYINTCFNQPRFFERLQFMPGAKEVIDELRDVYDDVKIVTHGYSPNLRLKEQWIEENLPGIEMVGINLKKYKDKSHVNMSDAFFLDDSSKNIKTSNAKYKAVFGDIYSWNKDWDGKRLCNWVDVRRELL